MGSPEKSTAPNTNTADNNNDTKLNYRDLRSVGQYGQQENDKFKATGGLDNRTKQHYKLSDINFSNAQPRYSEGSINNRTTVPKMIIYEFQPDLLFKWQQKLKSFKLSAQGAYNNTARVVKNVAGSSKFVKSAAQKLLDIFVEGDGSDLSVSSIGNELFVPQDDKEQQEAILNAPLRLYREFFEGLYLSSYEMPLTDEWFINADGHSGWSQKGEFKTSIDILSTLKKIIDQSFPSEVPIIPEWENKNDARIELSTTFHLYNDTKTNLLKNLRYLYDLAGGAYWIQVGWKQQPPNLYRVFIPGVATIMYASMHITVEHVGNRRKILEGTTTIPGSKIDLDSNTMYPDAYKVVISFNSLVPNNFNTQIDFLLNQDQQINVSRNYPGRKRQERNFNTATALNVKRTSDSAGKGK